MAEDGWFGVSNTVYEALVLCRKAPCVPRTSWESVKERILDNERYW